MAGTDRASWGTLKTNPVAHVWQFSASGLGLFLAYSRIHIGLQGLGLRLPFLVRRDMNLNLKPEHLP